MNPKGQNFATFSADRWIRIFDVKTGKITHRINETLQNYIDLGKENK